MSPDYISMDGLDTGKEDLFDILMEGALVLMVSYYYFCDFYFCLCLYSFVIWLTL